MPVRRSANRPHKFVETPDVRIHYVEIAEAPRPIILLHGIGMDWRVWQGTARRLRHYFHLYLLDLRGHGQSDKPAEGYTVAQYAADVEDFLDALGVQSAVLVGSSLGGAVAAAVEAPPDIIAHRVLVDPPLTGGPVRDPDGFREILRLKVRDVSLLAEHLRHDDPRLSADLAQTMAEMWHEAADGVISDMLARVDDYFALDDALRADESPTLLLQADPAMNPSLTPADAERALRLLPHGEAVIVKGAGHAIHADQPAEFVRLVLSFADRT
jgi:pimeloyl-ACP methyl ester carboxylesterase